MCSHPLLHSLTNWLTHSFTHSLTHLLTYSLTHSLNHWLTDSLTYSPTHSLTNVTLRMSRHCDQKTVKPISTVPRLLAIYNYVIWFNPSPPLHPSHFLHVCEQKTMHNSIWQGQKDLQCFRLNVWVTHGNGYRDATASKKMHDD